MAKTCMLTTYDNPFNPFDDFTSWYLFDMEKGYDSCGYLARILDKNGVQPFGDLSQHESDVATEQAIDEIIDFENDHFITLHMKVERNYDEDSIISTTTD